MQLARARKTGWIATRGALLAALIALVGCQPQKAAHQWNGEVVEPPTPAAEMHGVNWDGEPFRFSDTKGKVTVLFFGYTFCPDICPFTLAKMKQIYASLGDERASEVAMVFVSVDPHRDTVEKMARYVPNFDQRFYGIRLEFDELDNVQDGFGVTVQYGQPKDGPGSDSFYYVDHTGTFFIYDQAGMLRLKFPPNATADKMLPDIEALLEEGDA